MTNIVLFGSPGSGKGTLAQFLESEFNIKQLSTGHIFRKEFYTNPKYKKLQEALEAGEFASDELAIKIVEKFLDDHHNIYDGIAFDGFPRTVVQAEKMEEIFSERNMTLDLVIELKISKSEVVKRITGRYTCRNCGASYNKNGMNTKVKGICDYCGSTDLYHREEDNPEAISERLDIYHDRTLPLIKFYKDKGMLTEIHVGSDNSKEIQAKVIKLIDKSK